MLLYAVPSVTVAKAHYGKRVLFGGHEKILHRFCSTCAWAILKSNETE